jgi:NodT family efflux transporter outer membrane factor (OMF) lipoprotein
MGSSNRDCRRPPLLGLLAVVGLAGCGSLPEVAPVPAPALPDRFVRTEAQPVDQAAQTDLVRWWEHAGDPVLNSLARQLSSDNLDLKAATARLEIAQAALNLLQASLSPAGQVSAEAIRSRESLEVAPGALLRDLPGGYPRSQTRLGLQASASWEIDLFSTVRLGVNASQARMESATWGVQALRSSLTAHLADLYVQLRSTEIELSLTEQSLALQRLSTELVSTLAQRGLVADEERLRAQAEMAAAQSALPRLQARTTALLNAIDALLGHAPGSRLAVANTTPGRAPALPNFGLAPAPGRPTDLLSRRPDVLAAQAQARAASATLAQSQRAYYPTFNVNALVGDLAGSLGNVFSSESANAQAFLGVRWRLFDFARIDAEIAAARGQNREALAQFRAVALRAAHEVEDALVLLNANATELQQLRASQRATTQAQASAQRARQQGAIGERELIVAQRARLSSDRAVLRSQTAQQQHVVQLYRALGGGWSSADLRAELQLSTESFTAHSVAQTSAKTETTP